MNRAKPCLKAGRESPQSGQIRRTLHGFTLVEIMIVVAIIVFLTAIAVPGWTRYRNTTAISTCINNMRQINSAKVQWAFDEKKGVQETPPMTQLLPYFLGGTEPHCPGGGNYTVRAVSEAVICTMAVYGHTLE